MKAPRPVSLRVYSTDGKEYDVELKQGSAWSETAANVAALLPQRIEASSAEGKLLRAVIVDTLVAKEESATAQAQASFLAMQSTDPETQRMICFATLIERAHERATEAIRETVGAAFSMQREIADSLAQQAATERGTANELTTAIRNLLVQQAQEAADAITEQAQSPLERMAESFMTGQSAAGVVGAQAAAAKPTNGKH
jgi:uncharacterized protein (DUF2267 family)